MVLIRKVAEIKRISDQEAWSLVWALLERKRAEFREKGKIYYDEDFLADDIRKEFLRR